MSPDLIKSFAAGGLAPSTDRDHGVRGSKPRACPFDTPPLAWTRPVSAWASVPHPCAAPGSASAQATPMCPRPPGQGSHTGPRAATGSPATAARKPVREHATRGPHIGTSNGLSPWRGASVPEVSPLPMAREGPARPQTLQRWVPLEKAMAGRPTPQLAPTPPCTTPPFKAAPPVKGEAPKRRQVQIPPGAHDLTAPYPNILLLVTPASLEWGGPWSRASLRPRHSSTWASRFSTVSDEGTRGTRDTAPAGRASPRTSAGQAPQSPRPWEPGRRPGVQKQVSESASRAP